MSKERETRAARDIYHVYLNSWLTGVLNQHQRFMYPARMQSHKLLYQRVRPDRDDCADFDCFLAFMTPFGSLTGLTRPQRGQR